MAPSSTPGPSSGGLRARWGARHRRLRSGHRLPFVAAAVGVALVLVLAGTGCEAWGPSGGAALQGEVAGEGGEGRSTEVRSTEGPAAVDDDRGTEFRLSAPPSRVVSVVPSLTELVVALGAGDLLVARTRFDREAAVAHLPSVGGTQDPSLEAIVGLRPDLVIGWADEDRARIGARMTALGVPVYQARIRTLAELVSHTERLGHLLHREGEARALLHALDTRLGAVRARGDAAAEARSGHRPTVLYLVWHDPPQTAGPGTFLTELMEIAGGRNVMDDAPVPWPVVSMEEVLRRAPDALVVAPRHDGQVFRPPWLDTAPWQELEAVRADRILLVDPDLFNRPGPRVMEAAEVLEAFLAGLELP